MRSDAIDFNANQTYFIIEIVCFNAHTFFNLNWLSGISANTCFWPIFVMNQIWKQTKKNCFVHSLSYGDKSN